MKYGWADIQQTDRQTLQQFGFRGYVPFEFPLGVKGYTLPILKVYKL